MEQQKQPKIVQKLLIRTFFLLLGVAAVFLGINWVLEWRKDPDAGTADTNQMIVALEIFDEGQQAVMFDSSNKKIPSPGYEKGKTDRDITWLPDGNRVYFTSDRKESAYNLYRWNPASESVDPMSTGSLSKFEPTFPFVIDLSNKAAVEMASAAPLIVQGGFVLEYHLKDRASRQVLPPPSGVTVGADEGSGGAGQFDTLYKKYGNAFRTARWIGNGDFIATVVKGDEHETLIVQKMVSSGGTAEEQMREMTPKSLMAGDRVDIDVDPTTGRLVFTVLNFQFPDRDNIPKQFIKDGKIVKPFTNGVFVFDSTKAGTEALFPIAQSPDHKNVYGPPSVNPDGTQIAISSGSYDGYTYVPQNLAVVPLQPAGLQGATILLRGSIYEYSWHPTGTSLTYIKRTDGIRSIYKIGKDGSGETKVSDGGNYMTPKFSPQSK